MQGGRLGKGSNRGLLLRSILVEGERKHHRTHLTGQTELFLMIVCMRRKLPGVTGMDLGAARDAGSWSSTAPSSAESKPSTVAPSALRRAATPAAFRKRRRYGRCQNVKSSSVSVKYTAVALTLV